MSKEAMNLALELEEVYWSSLSAKHDTALREALAEQPAPRTWIGLTDEEREAIAVECGAMSADWLLFMEAVEQALKEKNV